MHSRARAVRDAVAVATALMAMGALCGNASAAFYIDCAGCHTVPQNGMAIANYQATADLGKGPLKVFQVNPGQTAVIQLKVTNSYGGEYGLNINSLDAPGVGNSSNHMACAADPAWSSYFPGTATNFFMVGCATASPDLGPSSWQSKVIPRLTFTRFRPKWRDTARLPACGPSRSLFMCR